MKITHRKNSSIPKEEAHGGSGARKLLVGPEHLKTQHFDAVTHGFLPAGNTFDWHEHDNTEEIMIVLKGTGTVHDEDGEYVYEPGDTVIFPANTQHKIHNPSNEEHEMIFVRIKL